MVVAFGAGYALYGLFRHWHFGSSAYDMGIFDQVVWHLSRFEAPASSVRGFSNFLGDHFFPVIALFAPLYWIAPRPESLIVAQAVLVAVRSKERRGAGGGLAAIGDAVGDADGAEAAAGEEDAGNR